jgi:hypothetical protein
MNGSNFTFSGKHPEGEGNTLQYPDNPTGG